MKNGEIYRGLLLNAEDTMNCSLSEVIRTSRTGKITKLPNVYLRGSGIRFIALPDLLKNAPCFQKVQQQKRKMQQAQAERAGMSMLNVVCNLCLSFDLSISHPCLFSNLSFEGGAKRKRGE
jgi:small nuclear ribonucleoprotein D3